MGFTPRLAEIDFLSRYTDKDVSKMDREYYDEARDAQLKAEFNAPNVKNLRILEAINGRDPAYAKHMLAKNDLLQGFAYKMGGGVDILKQPVCGRCEGVGTWGDFSRTVTDGKVGYCDACGHVTKNPITVEQYLAEYVQSIDDTTLDAIRPKLNELIELMEKGELE